MGFTRPVLAARSGVSVDSIKRFENTGKITLRNLLRIAVALAAVHEFTTLFPPPLPNSIDELEAQAARRGRTYGRRRDAGRRRGPRPSSSSLSEGSPPGTSPSSP
jgi:hypothetical protein